MTTQIANNDVLNSFIIHAKLIYPVEKIVRQLKNGEFLSTDIKWLNNKLQDFTKIACETLGINPALLNNSQIDQFDSMNDYVTGKYVKYFTGLLAYFKSF